MKVQEDMPKKQHVWHTYSRWWFQIYVYFTSPLGEDFHFDSYFSNGLKPPTRIPIKLLKNKYSIMKSKSLFFSWLN